jgi:hypothetical protein
MTEPMHDSVTSKSIDSVEVERSGLDRNPNTQQDPQDGIDSNLKKFPVLSSTSDILEYSDFFKPVVNCISTINSTSQVSFEKFRKSL